MADHHDPIFWRQGSMLLLLMTVLMAGCPSTPCVRQSGCERHETCLAGACIPDTALGSETGSPSGMEGETGVVPSASEEGDGDATSSETDAGLDSNDQDASTASFEETSNGTTSIASSGGTQTSSVGTDTSVGSGSEGTSDDTSFIAR